MACGCGKNKKVSAFKKTGDVEYAYQVVAFTGKRPGAISYSAEGTERYSLGNTSFAQQANVRAIDFPKLKQKYGNQLMVIPGDLQGIYLPGLAEDIHAVEALEPFALGLEDLEIETVGEVLATSKDILVTIMGDSVNDVIDALRLRVGLENAYA